MKIDAETKARLARASASVGQQFDYEASLLLDSPEKLRIAEQFLRAKSRDHFGLGATSNALSEQIDRQGTVTVATRNNYETAREYGGQVAAGLKVGGKYAVTRSGSRLSSAETRRPGSVFAARGDCTQRQ